MMKLYKQSFRLSTSTVTIMLLILLACSRLSAKNEVIRLKTQNMDDVIGISSFVINSKNEIFLFSHRLSRIFKFKPDGTFEKRFLQKGEGPGEIIRVFYMTHNPFNDNLYLPEYVSVGKGKVTIYNGDGNYKGLLKPQISLRHMDRIKKLIFLKDGSYLVVTSDRVDWKPVGKFYITQYEIWIRQFNRENKLISDVFKTVIDGNLSNKVRYGGIGILFSSSLLTELTPDQNIAVSKTDENTISIYNLEGNKIKTINLDIPREKLSMEEFNKAKKIRLKEFEREKGSRMHFLAKNMIKLEYKSIYLSQFLTPQYIILEKIDSRDSDGYIKTIKLVFFNWKGQKKGEKIVNGIIMNISKGKGLIKEYDNDSTEHFRIETGILDF